VNWLPSRSSLRPGRCNPQAAGPRCPRDRTAQAGPVRPCRPL
jgi:hypothetical protein